MNNNNNNKSILENSKTIQIGELKYIYHNTAELISIYESEFYELGDIIKSLFETNEEMLKYDPNDYDLIQARLDNVESINKKIKKMIDIQNKVKILCNNHPILSLNVMEIFNKENKKENDDNNIKKEEEEKNFNEEENNMNMNINQNNNDNNNNNYLTDEEILKELEL